MYLPQQLFSNYRSEVWQLNFSIFFGTETTPAFFGQQIKDHRLTTNNPLGINFQNSLGLHHHSLIDEMVRTKRLMMHNPSNLLFPQTSSHSLFHVSGSFVGNSASTSFHTKQTSQPKNECHVRSLSPRESNPFINDPISDSFNHEVNNSETTVAVHPIFAVSPSQGITYSWISPPKALPRKRTVFTRRQRTDLESKFQAQKYISKSERIRFARELGLKDSQVCNQSKVTGIILSSTLVIVSHFRYHRYLFRHSLI